MKKMIKVLGIALACLAALLLVGFGLLLIKNRVDAQRAWLAKDYYTAFQSASPLEQRYAGPGGMDVASTVIKSEDDTIQNIRLWYPASLEMEQEKVPLVLVANASNMAALNYEPFFERLASWGFVVVGNDDRQTGTGQSLSQTLDCVLALPRDENSIFYGKIDEENIGIVGYSQGGAGAIRAATAYDNGERYKTIFTASAAYALLAQNMGWGYDISKLTIPYFMTAGTGSSDDSGEDAPDVFAGVCPLFSLIDNYNGMGDDVFKIRARVVGAEHDEMQARTDGYMTAWMLYQLQGDEQAAVVFVGEDAEILQNANWQDVEKND